MTRHNTSASNVPRRVRCPGSAAAERGLPETDSEYSSEGTMLHAAFAAAPLGEQLPERIAFSPEMLALLTKAGFMKADRFELSPAQRDLVEHARRLASEAVEKAVDEFHVAVGDPFEEGFERELWFRKGIKPIIPGHCDYWRYYPSLRLLIIIDAKFGFSLVPNAGSNWQLLTYALAGASEFAVMNCVVAIVQPRATMAEDGETLSIAVYETSHLQLARSELLAARDEWESPDAKRIASKEACEYCKAKLLCDTYRDRLSPAVTLSEGVFPSPADIPYETLLALRGAVSFAKRIEADVNAELMRRILEGSAPGLRLKENAPRRTITDRSLAAGLLRAAGLADEIIDGLGGIPFGALETAVRKDKGISGPAAKAWVNETLALAIELAPTKPTVAEGEESSTRRLL